MTTTPAPAPLAQRRPRLARLMKPAGYLVALVVFAWLRLEHLAAILASPVAQIPIIDSVYYLDWGRRVAEGLGLGPHPFFMSPLYPLFIVFAGSLGDGFVATTMQLQIVLSAGTMLLVGRYAARRIIHPLGGPFAALLFALYAPAIYYDAVLLSTSLILFLTMVALTILDDPPKKLPWWRFAGAGLAVGLSALARPNALILLPAFAIVFLVWGRRYAGRPANFRRAWLRVGIFVAAAGLVILPAMLRNVRLGGEFALTTSSAGVNLWIGNHDGANGLYTEAPFLQSADPVNEAMGYRIEASRRVGRELDDLDASRFWMGEAMEYILVHPLEWTGLLARKFAWFTHDTEAPNNVSFYGALEYSPVLRKLDWFSFGVLLALGIPGLLFFGGGRAMHLPRALLIAYLVANMMFFVAGEYRYPVVGVLVMAAAVTVFRVIRHFRSGDPIPSLRALIAVVLLIVFTHIPWDLMKTVAAPETDYFNWASVSYDEGDLTNASLLFSAALAERPNWRDAHLQLALVFQQMGLQDQAQREFDAAGVSQEDLIRLIQQDRMLAAEWLGTGGDTLSALPPEELAAVAARFNVLGKHGAALSAAETALAKDSTNMRARFEQAFALEATGHLAAAVQKYQRIEYLTQVDPMPAYRIAWCYYGLGEGRNAQKALERAKVKARQLPDGRYRQQWLDKLDKAVDQLGNF